MWVIEMPELDEIRKFRLPIFADYSSHSARLARVPNNKSVYLQENPIRKEVYMFTRDEKGSAVAVKTVFDALSELEKSVWLRKDLHNYFMQGYKLGFG